MDTATAHQDPGKTLKLVSSFRVLHVEPSVEVSLNLRAELRRAGFSFTMERVSSADSAEKAISDAKWDLIICEYMLPMLTVEMILAWLRQRKLDVPVIVFSETRTDRALVDSMRAGARDYIFKDKTSDLIEAVEREIQELHLRSMASKERRFAMERNPDNRPRIMAPVTGGHDVDPELCGVETVLLVDDDPTFREFMNWTLRRHGYHVIQAKDGEEAHYIMNHYLQKIHIMICDVIMPNLDGLELAHRVCEGKPEMKVIMVSGFNDNPLDRAHYIAGRYPLVWKPFDVAKVLRMMRELLVGTETASASLTD